MTVVYFHTIGNLLPIYVLLKTSRRYIMDSLGSCFKNSVYFVWTDRCTIAFFMESIGSGKVNSLYLSELLDLE